MGGREEKAMGGRRKGWMGGRDHGKGEEDEARKGCGEQRRHEKVRYRREKRRVIVLMMLGEETGRIRKRGAADGRAKKEKGKSLTDGARYKREEIHKKGIDRTEKVR